MKRLLYLVLIMLILCSCKGSRRIASKATEGLASGIAESFGKAGGEAMIRSFDPQTESNQQALWATANQINQSTPIQVDQETILTNATVQENTLIYNYTLINYSSYEVDPNEIVNGIYPSATNYVCSHPDMQAALQKGISFQYSYFGNDRTFITRFTITPTDCGYQV